MYKLAQVLWWPQPCVKFIRPRPLHPLQALGSFDHLLADRLFTVLTLQNYDLLHFTRQRHLCWRCQEEMPRGRWHVTQMFLERRLKGACVAAHAAYHDEAYFRELTGLPDVKWIHDKRTETTVTLTCFLTSSGHAPCNVHTYGGHPCPDRVCPVIEDNVQLQYCTYK